MFCVRIMCSDQQGFPLLAVCYWITNNTLTHAPTQTVSLGSLFLIVIMIDIQQQAAELYLRMSNTIIL